MKRRDDLKFLLVQIRVDRDTMQEELNEFLEYGHLNDGQIDCLNVYDIPDFLPQIVDDYDGLFIGGSSDASVLEPEKNEFLPACYRLIRHCYDKHIPVFASCFGFQLAVVELGGQVILDKDNMEMGCLPISILDITNDDPLCHDLSKSLYAICGHKERAVKLPVDAINLATTDKCPFQLFKIKDRPFYASQFHPEVSVNDFIERITRYQTRYFSDLTLFQASLDAVAGLNTREANQLIAKFIDRIVLPQT